MDPRGASPSKTSKFDVFTPSVLNLIRPANVGIKFNTDASQKRARIKFNTIRIKFNTDDSSPYRAVRSRKVGYRPSKALKIFLMS